MLSLSGMQTLPQTAGWPAWPDDFAQYALEQCAEAVLLADREGRVLYANAAARALLGYSPDEGLECGIEELFPELPRLVAAAGARSETVCRHRNGRQLAVEVVLGQPMMEGRSFQLACVHEIAERKRLEAQLREARKMETVGRLVAGVSHDFNNLLTAILIYTGLLLNQLPAESPLRRQAEQVNVAAERGRSLVAHLTALGERRSCQPALLSLNEVVESVRDMLSRLLGEHITLEIRCGQPLGKL